MRASQTSMGHRPQLNEQMQNINQHRQRDHSQQPVRGKNSVNMSPVQASDGKTYTASDFFPTSSNEETSRVGTGTIDAMNRAFPASPTSRNTSQRFVLPDAQLIEETNNQLKAVAEEKSCFGPLDLRRPIVSGSAAFVSFVAMVALTLHSQALLVPDSPSGPALNVTGDNQTTTTSAPPSDPKEGNTLYTVTNGFAVLFFFSTLFFGYLAYRNSKPHNPNEESCLDSPENSAKSHTLGDKKNAKEYVKGLSQREKADLTKGFIEAIDHGNHIPSNQTQRILNRNGYTQSSSGE